MKLEFHPLITIRISNNTGARLVWHLLLFLRCAVLSLFVYVAALKSWSPFPGDKVIIQSAKYLAYPIFLIEKPMLRSESFLNYFHQVPNGLGLMLEFPARSVQINEVHSTSGFFVSDIHFQHPHFVLHMVFFSFWYFVLANLGQIILRKLRPNP